MKKLLFIIASIFIVGIASITGCNSNKTKDGTSTKDSPYNLRQTLPNIQNEELPDGQDENQCPGGNCGNPHERPAPDFRFREPRCPDDDIREPGDGCGDKPCPLPRKPHRRGHGDGNTVPLPEPKPVHPKN